MRVSLGLSTRLSGHDEHVGRPGPSPLAWIEPARPAPGQVPHAGLLKWVLRNRAYTPWYLVRYWRLLKFKLANPHIITRGMVFLGKGVEIHATPELAQLEIGRWVHIGDKNTIRAHEGSLRFGDKVVLGRDNVINAYLDIELGDSVLMADWCYVCDFDHRMDNIDMPIKDQGIVKSPVRIGPTPGWGSRCRCCGARRSGAVACWDRMRWCAG